MATKTQDGINTYFPILKWIWGGAFILILGIGTVLLNFKLDSLNMQNQIELNKQVDSAQDSSIRKLSEALSQMSQEQKRTTEAINNLNLSIKGREYQIIAMIEESKKSNELLSARLDSHIALMNASK